MAIIDDVKLAMRITHNGIDGELAANILEAKAEMARVGMDEAVINEEGPLVVAAIKTYCKMVNADTEASAERYDVSWKYQIDCLRKTYPAKAVTVNV